MSSLIATSRQASTLSYGPKTSASVVETLLLHRYATLPSALDRGASPGSAWGSSSVSMILTKALFFATWLRR